MGLGISPLAGMERPYRVGPAMAGEAGESFPHLRPEERVIDPSLRLVNIEIGWHDIVVAGKHRGRPAREQSAA